MPKNTSKELPAGSKFARLTVVKLHHQDNRWRRHYLCKCDCGKTSIVIGSHLICGNTRSCGCMATELKKSKRMGNDAGVINHLVLQYKRHAGARNLEFAIDRERFEKLVRSPCFYCGEPAGNLKRTKNFKEGFRHNGIDRMDSSKDYTPDNCVPCCGQCNRAKRDTPQAVFIAWIHRASKHLEAMAQQWTLATRPNA